MLCAVNKEIDRIKCSRGNQDDGWTMPPEVLEAVTAVMMPGALFLQKVSFGWPLVALLGTACQRCRGADSSSSTRNELTHAGCQDHSCV
uniref:Uncharacterized protein n=1 Tax=Ascaris lumbricoides TaxID=6252 RepID=A0A0M3I2Y5_ASCLU